MHKRTFAQERRVSARRGSLNPALCGCNRAMFDDDRTDDQERLASARRGYRYRTLQTGACTNSRQTAEGGCAGRRCVRVQVNHGGLTPPRSCVAVRTSAGETTIFAMHKRTFD
jgi:hypothetical protein